MGKVLIIVSIIVALLTAGLGVVNKGKLTETKATLASTEADLGTAKENLGKAQAELKTTAENLATTAAERDQVKAQVASLNKDLDAHKAQVTDLTSQKEALQKQFDETTAERDQLKTQLAATTGTESTTGDANQLQELQTQVQELQTLNTKLTADLTENNAKLNEYVEKDAQRQKQQLQKGVEGKVLAVNPAWNFVVLSLGDKSGLSSNTELLVKRGNQFVGKVRVTSVEPSTSIADIVANSVPQGISISPNDKVIFQGSEQ